MSETNPIILYIQILVPCVTFILGTIMTKNRIVYSEKSQLLKDTAMKIDRLQALTTEYWVNDYNYARASILEASIRGAIFDLSILGEALKKNLGKTIYKSDYYPIFLKLITSASGGTFETSDREPCKERAIECIQYCCQMASLLRQQR